MGETFSEIATKTSEALSEKGITREGKTDIPVATVVDKVTEGGTDVPDTKADKVVTEKDNQESADTTNKDKVDKDKVDKKGTYNHKISQMTARIKATEDRANKLENELRIEREKNSSAKGLEDIKRMLMSKDKGSDDEDAADSDENEAKPVTLEDIQKMLDAREEKLKQQLEEEKAVSAIDKLNTEFADLIKKDYDEDYDNELDALSDEAQEQVDQLIALYRSNPSYWLDQFKKVGIKQYAERLSGNVKAEKSATEIEKASRSLEMEGNSIPLSKEDVTGKKFSDIAAAISSKLAAAGITRK